jgi:hypothetical protein
MSDHDPSDQHAFRAATGAGPTPDHSRKRPPRRHEWTGAKMDAFLDELRATQSVWRAARAVGMGRQSAYKLKRRMAPFAADWDSALAERRLEGSLAPFLGPRACPLCGAEPGRMPQPGRP